MTTVEIATIVSYSVTFNCEEARRLFVEKFNKDPPPARTLRAWKSRFLETLSVFPRSHAGDQSTRQLPEEKKQEVLLLSEHDPTTSQRQASRESGVSLGKVNSILKDDGLHPWKFTSVQELKTDDQPKRLEFCHVITERQRRDPNFVQNICFSDEATFHINGSVNRHNAFVYSHENPRSVSVQPMRSPSLMCWAMISPKFGIIFHISTTTMNGELYEEVLNTHVIPRLKQRRYHNLLFQQDGAPAHYATRVRYILNSELPGRWIGRGGSIQWPPRSPDLSINDFWLWGDIRNRLYSPPRPRTLPDLRSRLENFLQNVPLEMIERSYQSFIKRCDLCIANQGGHFEHLL